MAKGQQEQTTHGLNRSTMALVALVITVLAASAFWKDRGGDQAVAAAAINSGIVSNTSRNDLQDEQIESTQKEVTKIKEEQHKAELSRVQMTSDIGQTKEDVGEIKDDFKELKSYLMQYDFGKKDDE